MARHRPSLVALKPESVVKRQPTNDMTLTGASTFDKWQRFSFEKVTGRPRQNHDFGEYSWICYMLELCYYWKNDWASHTDQNELNTRISRRHLWECLRKGGTAKSCFAEPYWKWYDCCRAVRTDGAARDVYEYWLSWYNDTVLRIKRLTETVRS